MLINIPRYRCLAVPVKDFKVRQRRFQFAAYRLYFAARDEHVCNFVRMIQINSYIFYKQH